MLRINQIWITPIMTQRILDYKCLSQFIINSDHKALSIIIDWFKYNSHHFSSNRIYNFNKIKPEKLLKYSEDTELKLSNCQFPFWDLLNSTIKASLELNIPKKKHNYK